VPRLYLVRHGAVDGGRRFYGHLDLPLSAEGRRQIERAAAFLRRIELTAIHCSDLDRARESARIIGAGYGLAPLPDPAFREMHLGVLEGLPFTELKERHPQLSDKRYEDMWSFRFPGGGENLEDIAHRARPALRAILGAHPDPETNVVLVAHNSVNRIVIGDALGLPLSQVFNFSQDFGCINRIDYDGEKHRVSLMNHTPRD
jgi:broad specificity phosphatase PhoE